MAPYTMRSAMDFFPRSITVLTKDATKGLLYRGSGAKGRFSALRLRDMIKKI